MGLLAATLARLYSSTLYALRDTRTPLKYASVRVALTAALGVLCGLWLPRALHLDPRLGAVGLTASAGVAGWVEFALLRRAVARRVGTADVPASLLAKLWAAAIGAGAAAVGVRLLVAGLPPTRVGAVAKAAAVFGCFGAVYLGVTLAFGVPEASAALQRARRLLRR